MVDGQVCDVSLSKVIKGKEVEKEEKPARKVTCYLILSGEACCGSCLCRLYCEPGYVPGAEEISVNLNCNREGPWKPHLSRSDSSA